MDAAPVAVIPQIYYYIPVLVCCSVAAVICCMLTFSFLPSLCRKTLFKKSNLTAKSKGKSNKTIINIKGTEVKRKNDYTAVEIFEEVESSNQSNTVTPSEKNQGESKQANAAIIPSKLIEFNSISRETKERQIMKDLQITELDLIFAYKVLGLQGRIQSPQSPEIVVDPEMENISSQQQPGKIRTINPPQTLSNSNIHRSPTFTRTKSNTPVAYSKKNSLEVNAVSAKKKPRIPKKPATNSVPQSTHLTPRAVRFDDVLIIAVDATPWMGGGYLEDKAEKRVEYYSEGVKEMPWKLIHKNDPSEFEMKNLLTALLQFDEKLSHRKVKIYTDNNAIMGRKGPYARRVKSFVKHLVECRGVTVLNSGHFYVNRKKGSKEFKERIQPADDLSRGNVENFLCTMEKRYFPLSCDDFAVGVDLKKARHNARKLKKKGCRNCRARFPESMEWSLSKENGNV